MLVAMKSFLGKPQVRELTGLFRSKNTKVSMMAFALMMAFATSAFAAEGDPIIDTSTVINVFKALGAAVLIIIAGIAAVAVSVMAAFLAWKYGRKAWNMIAK